MGLGARLAKKCNFPKLTWVVALVGVLTLTPLLASCAHPSLALDGEAAASEAVASEQADTSAEAPAVGHKGEVEIHPELLADGNVEPNFNAKLIKTFGLETSLRGNSLLADAHGEPLSFDELLSQKLQRLGVQDTATDQDPAAQTDPTAEGAEATAEAELAAQEQELPLYKTQLYDTGILDINDVFVEYVDGFLATEAPEQGAALWAGSDSVLDGFLGYFIGHNPGDFTPVLSLTLGDPVTVYDRYGDERTYYVVDTFIVPNTSRFIDIEDRLFGYGESIALQTCLDDNENFLVVVAA